MSRPPPVSEYEPSSVFLNVVTSSSWAITVGVIAASKNASHCSQATSVAISARSVRGSISRYFASSSGRFAPCESASINGWTSSSKPNRDRSASGRITKYVPAPRRWASSRSSARFRRAPW